MKATTRKADLDSFDCFLHKVQLAIGDGMKIDEIEGKVATCRALITHFNKSSPFQVALGDWQKHFYSKETTLLQVIHSLKLFSNV